jgi:CRP/FNR family transcriptional regulator
MQPIDPAGIPMLAVLRAKDRDTIVRQAKQRTYGPGETVVREGDSALNLFIVARGSARVEVDGVGQVGRLQAGEFFGELGLIEQHGRTATVIAEDELTCLLLPAWEFRSLLREHPEMAVPMLETVIARLHAREHHA